MPGMLLNCIIVWCTVGDPIDNFRTSCARRANPLNFVQAHQSAPAYDGGNMFWADFRRQLKKVFGLTAVKILYQLPDHPGILQSYVRQRYDLHP